MTQPPESKETSHLPLEPPQPPRPKRGAIPSPQADIDSATPYSIQNDYAGQNKPDSSEYPAAKKEK